MNKNFTISSDPEFPVKDQYGRYRSIIGHIGGSKDDPRPLENGCVQEDNVLLEMNPKPATSCDEFVRNHILLLADIQQLLKPLDLSISIDASAIYDDSELEDAFAKMAGCTPDYDAWTLWPNNPPDLSETNLRSAAGHLHVGFDWANNDVMNRAYLARVFDLTGTIPSLLLDTDTRRRSLYGKAGCHRPKIKDEGHLYDGVELRSLSNFWLKSEDMMRWAYQAVKSAFDRFDEIMEMYQNDSFTDHIIDTINTQNLEAAYILCRQHNLLPGLQPIGGSNV